MAALGEVKVFGARGGVAPRLLVNPDTFCDGRGVFFVAASGQIRVAANTCAVQAGRAVPARRDRNLTGAARCRGCRGGPAWRGLGRRVIPRRWCFFLVLPDYASIVTWVLAMPSIGFAVLLVVLASGLRRGRLVALWLLAGAGRRDWPGWFWATVAVHLVLPGVLAPARRPPRFTGGCSGGRIGTGR
jgi:hypothetical protein